MVVAELDRRGLLLRVLLRLVRCCALRDTNTRHLDSSVRGLRTVLFAEDVRIHQRVVTVLGWLILILLLLLMLI